MGRPELIRTPDQRVRVFVSSALRELSAERGAVRDAVTRLRLVPVMFELGARPHPARQVYRDYLAQSQVFVGVYWQSYGWVAPGEQISGLEDEYLLSAGLPRLIYVKSPAPDREPRLAQMLARIEDEGGVSYQHFSDAAQLQRFVEDDLALLLSERFGPALPAGGGVAGVSLAGILPTPATPLAGRDQETRAVMDLVRGEGVREVTLTGPGGVGKSRLAVEVAQRLEPSFADGVRFVDLTPVRAADLVAAAIAAGVGLNTSGSRLIADLKTFLRPRGLLLVLDNFEQVTDAAPLVADLLSAAPGVVALVTSRTLLRLTGEHEFPVPPLAVPPGPADRDVAEAGRYPSVRLFVERARAVAPGFELTSENARIVAQICRRLDGLPLAIELAAAKVRMLPPAALLARLDHAMRLLTGGARDLPKRQRTLRDTLDWSFDLLEPSQQALFARLAVFAGTFSLSAVEAMFGDADAASPAGPGRDGQVTDTLSALVDNSLVRAENQDGEPRFALLETIREYAQERLAEGSDWQEAHDRHAAYFAALAEPAPQELQGNGQLAWLARLEAEYENLGATMSWLLAQNRQGAVVHLMWATWRFWWLRGHAEELTRYGEKLLASIETLPPHEQALALCATAFNSTVGGDRATGQARFEQSLPLYRAAGDTLGAALASSALAHLLAEQHQDARAAELLEQTLAGLRGAGDDALTGSQHLAYLVDVSLACNFLGQIRLSQGNPEGAAHLFGDALRASRGTPDGFAILVSLYDLALSSQARGDLNGSAASLREGLSLATEAGDGPSSAYYLEAMAAAAQQQGMPEHAVRLLAGADALLQAKGSGWLHAYVPRAPSGDAVLSALRTRLGDSPFEEAWAEGRSAGGQHAVQDALDEGQPGALPERL